MEDLKEEAYDIWASIEKNITSLYYDIADKLEEDSANEVFNKLDCVFSVMSCGTDRIQGIIWGRVLGEDEILSLSEIEDIIEITECLKYYSSKKLDEFKNNMIPKEDEEAIYYLVLYRSIIFSLQANCISLKRRTSKIVIK